MSFLFPGQGGSQGTPGCQGPWDRAAGRWSGELEGTIIPELPKVGFARHSTDLRMLTAMWDVRPLISCFLSRRLRTAHKMDRDRHIIRQTDTQTDKQPGHPRHTDTLTDKKLTDRETDRDRQTDGQTDKQTDRQTERQADRQTARQTYRQTDRQTGRQTDRPDQTRQPDRQANRQTKPRKPNNVTGNSRKTKDAKLIELTTR